MEVLVVVGIIALLVAILMPSMSRARKMAISVTCLSGLRQMSIAAQTYVASSKEHYPIAYYSAVDGGRSIGYAWDLTTIGEGGRLRVVPGLLWMGRGADAIQQCPAFQGKANWGIDPYTGYNYNTSYIGHGQYENIVPPSRVTDVRRPAGTALFGDGEYVSGANKFMRAPFDSGSDSEGDDTFNGRWAGTQGFRHLKKTNVAFCDGHGESRLDRFTETDDYGGAANIAPGTGFLSKDNSLYDLH